MLVEAVVVKIDAGLQEHLLLVGHPRRGLFLRGRAFLLLPGPGVRHGLLLIGRRCRLLLLGTGRFNGIGLFRIGRLSVRFLIQDIIDDILGLREVLGDMIPGQLPARRRG